MPKLLPAEITYLEAAPSDQSNYQVWSDVTSTSVPDMDDNNGAVIGAGQENINLICINIYSPKEKPKRVVTP